jgi:chaperone required for assembly of F1-ATPase
MVWNSSPSAFPAAKRQDHGIVAYGSVNRCCAAQEQAMRDLLEDLFKAEPLDPVEAARRSVRRPIRKRFYETASVGEDLSVRLDRRPIRTPAWRPLQGPNPTLAQAIADEWDAQREVVDPAAMPLTRLANAIIDGVADAPGAVRAEIEKYLGSDLMFYRADGPEGLVARQSEHWDPLLTFARDEFDARFVLAQGVMHTEQPREAIAAASRAIPVDPWQLGAVSAITTITGSALIALALAHGAIEPDQAWAAAHVDEDWQISKWGEDADALARRTARRAEFDAAVMVLVSLR